MCEERDVLRRSLAVAARIPLGALPDAAFTVRGEWAWPWYEGTFREYGFFSKKD